MTSAGNKSLTKEDAFKICQEFLSGPWLEIEVGDFRYSVVRGGLSNSIYRCTIPETVLGTKDPRIPSDVLLRIYGLLQDETNIIVTEATTFMLLAERKLGPKLYGIFPNGRLEEFIPSRTVKTEDYRALYPEIARELAKVHAMDVPVRKIPDFWWVHMKKFLILIEDEYRKLNKNFEHKELYYEEMEWLSEEIKKSKSPIVYCHNDLQGGNILLKQNSAPGDSPRIVLIDFEFGSYNYRTFDLANQFNEWCFDYSTGEYPFYTFDFNKFPSEEEQTSYIMAYLDELVKAGALDESMVDQELSTILKEIPVFAMAANCLWSLWSVKMSLIAASDDFSHWEHGKTRRKFYFDIKEQYTKNRLRNGHESKSDEE